MNGIEISSSVPSAALERRRLYIESGELAPDDCAVYAMTDFRRECPICVAPGTSIEAALADMNRLGIHALLVTRPDAACGHEQMLGLITAYRIRQRAAHERRLPPSLRASVCMVGEIMTPWDQLALVNYRSLRYLNASEVYQMFQGSGLTHVMVVETDDDDSVVARGLISRAALASRLREESSPALGGARD
ncbi:MAG TPA: CBS domain-containing protein [Steroidobacteraceae bacterium]|nr:CBS domain-containing protein [Steroidobacteraceae bacterium]